MKKKKLGSFQVIKLTSRRLKKCNFKLGLTYKEGVRNNEVIKLGQNPLCEQIQKIMERKVDFPHLESLEDKRRQIRKRKNSNLNREELKGINEEILTFTFIPELIAIQFDDKRHYNNILDKGLFINEKEFVRALASAGNIRNNTVFFVDKAIYGQLRDVLDAGRCLDAKHIPSKLVSYLGLYGTASHPVSFPEFTVINDYEFKRMAKLNWIDDDGKIELTNKEIKINCFDGQGLLSPRLAKAWGEELGLDYIPSTMILRAPFIKGQCATFDFSALSNELGVGTGTDIWGDSFIISEQDLILSASQFKLGSQSYDSLSHYIDEINKRDFGFRVTRYSKSQIEMNRDTTLNYMYIQSVNLDGGDVENLVEDTVTYFKEIELEDHLKTSLYLSGSASFPHDFNEENFENLDIISKSLLSHPPLLTETYISQRIRNVIKKKERQAKLGKLYVEGCYAPLISDPYAQVEWMCGITPKGLLREHQSYSDFWNMDGVEKVACGRSPLTHSSEMMCHDLVSTKDMRRWYKYQETSYIFNIHGLSAIRAAAADFDGDLLFSTSSEQIIDGRIPDVPISYDTGKAEKISVSEEDVGICDVRGMGSKIGFITNISSFYHTLKHEYEVGSTERIEIDGRQISFRKSQGAEIDRAKHGDSIAPVPQSWTRWSKDLSDLDMALIAERRPYFMRYNYANYDKKYKKERDKYNKLCWSHFGRSFQDVLDDDGRSKKEQDAVDKYYKYSDFIFTPSPMNKVTWKMEEELSSVHNEIKSKSFDYTSLFSTSSFIQDIDLLDKMEHLYIQYRSVKAAWRKTQDKNIKKDIYHIISKIRQEAEEDISSNMEELGNHAVQLMIENGKARGFSWDVFGDAIVENLLNRYGHQIDILVQDDYGEEEHLYQKYSKRSVYV